ncbi:hypothetical protein [Streptomyces sp. ISL-36]|uniref:hypothetical protein n=1 Tax=Streptomyces sp. ISL-36 TaxID=2819182 RepID=UPI002035AF5A|nr:hypothetical protein [Streptomyces sp. ISL-36]
MKALWELHLNMELEHLRIACDLMRRHDCRDPEEILAPQLPNVLTFEPNKDYVRELLATQIDLTTLGAGYVREAHERFEKMQRSLHDAARSLPATASSISTARCSTATTGWRPKAAHPVESKRA